MAAGSMGVVGSSSGGSTRFQIDQKSEAVQQVADRRQTTVSAASAPTPTITGQGAQFVYAAVTVANILCANLTRAQINLLANFLSVVTTCTYAIFTVEAPEIGEIIDEAVSGTGEETVLFEPLSEQEEPLLQ